MFHLKNVFIIANSSAEKKQPERVLLPLLPVFLILPYGGLYH